MLDEKDIALLEAYTYGDLAPENEADLRDRLRADADFAAEVRQWELMDREGFVATPTQATLDAVQEAMRTTTPAAEEPATADPPPQRPAWILYLLGVLLLALLGYAGWTWLSGPSTAPAVAPPTETPSEQPPSIDDNVYAGLVDEYFRHLPSENFHLGSEETLEERALAAYESRDYATALPLLLETVEMGGDSINLLYAGVAALGVGESTVALIQINRFKRQNQVAEFDDFSTYITALAYLRNGEVEECKVALKVLESNPYFSEAIIEISEKIK